MQDDARPYLLSAIVSPRAWHPSALHKIPLSIFFLSSLFNFVYNHHQTITIPSMASAVLRRGDHHTSSSFRRHQATSTSLFLSSASASVSRIENNRVHPNNNIHLQLHHYNCNSPIVYPMRQHHRMHPAGADIPYYQQRYDMITDELCYVKCAMLKHKTHDDDDDHRRS